MSTLDWMIGPVAALAALGALAVYAASAVQRERRGPGAHAFTLRSSRPILTALFALSTLAGAALLALRLGALS